MMSNADEIVKRLRRRHRWQLRVDPQGDPDSEQAAALIEQQRDEIARLREALNHIARDDHATPDVIGWNDTDSLKAVRKFARRALEGTTPAGLDRQEVRADTPERR